MNSLLIHRKVINIFCNQCKANTQKSESKGTKLNFNVMNFCR